MVNGLVLIKVYSLLKATRPQVLFFTITHTLIDASVVIISLSVIALYHFMCNISAPC